MGSPPTLDPDPTRPPDPSRQAVTDDGELLEHLQTPAAFGGHEFQEWPVQEIAGNLGGDLDLLHDHDHIHLARQLHHRHPQRDILRQAEQAFDWLNPTYGVPADQRSTFGR